MNPTVLDLTVNGDPLTTTEDHPFWNVTDQQWQRADQLDTGDEVRTADGRMVATNGFRPATRHTATAYNMTVDALHTYYVLAGDVAVLVHNDNPRYDWDPEEDDETFERNRHGDNRRSRQKVEWQMREAGLSTNRADGQRDMVHRQIGDRAMGDNRNLPLDELKEAIDDAGETC